MVRMERGVVLDSAAIERHQRAREVEHLRRRVYLLNKENIELRKNRSSSRDQRVTQVNGQAEELATCIAELRELGPEAESLRACDETRHKHEAIGDLMALKLEHSNLLSSHDVLLSAHTALQDSHSMLQQELDGANSALARATEDARVLQETCNKKCAEAQEAADRFESALNEEKDRGAETSESLSRIRTANRDLAKQVEEKRIELTQMKRDKKSLQDKLQKSGQQCKDMQHRCEHLIKGDKKNLQDKLQKGALQRQELELRCEQLILQRDNEKKEHDKITRRLTAKLDFLKAQARKNQKSMEDNASTQQSMLADKKDSTKHAEHELRTKIDELTKLVQRVKTTKTPRRATIHHTACQASACMVNASTNAAASARQCEPTTELKEDIPCATTPSWSSRSPPIVTEECVAEDMDMAVPTIVNTLANPAPSYSAATMDVATITGSATMTNDATCAAGGLGTTASMAKDLFLQGVIGEEQFAEVAFADIPIPQGEELGTAWAKMEHEVPNIPAFYGDKWPQFVAAKTRMEQAVQNAQDGLKSASAAARKWEARCEVKVAEKRAIEMQLAATLGELQATTERLSVRNNEHGVLSEQLSQSKWRIVSLENKVYKSDLEKQRRDAASVADNIENDELAEGITGAEAVAETGDAELGSAGQNEQNGVLLDESTAAFYERVRHRAEMRALREGRSKAVEALRAAKDLDACLRDQRANAPRVVDGPIPVHTIIAATHDRIAQKQNQVRAIQERAPEKDSPVDDVSGITPSSGKYLTGDTPSATEDLVRLFPSELEGDDKNHDDKRSTGTAYCSILGDDSGIAGSVPPTSVRDSMLSTGPKTLLSSVTRRAEHEATARIVYSMQRITSQQSRAGHSGAAPETPLTVEDLPAVRRGDHDNARRHGHSSRGSMDTVTASMHYRRAVDGELSIGRRAVNGELSIGRRAVDGELSIGRCAVDGELSIGRRSPSVGSRESVFVTQGSTKATSGFHSTISTAVQGRRGGDEGTTTLRKHEDGQRTDRDATLVRSGENPPCARGGKDEDIAYTCSLPSENETPKTEYRICRDSGNASNTQMESKSVENESLSSSSADGHRSLGARKERQLAEQMKSALGTCHEEPETQVFTTSPDPSADTRTGVTLPADPPRLHIAYGAHARVAPAVCCRSLVVPSSQTPTFVCVRAENPDAPFAVLPPTRTAADGHVSNISRENDGTGGSGPSYAVRESNPIAVSQGERAMTGDIVLEDLLACGYEALVDLPHEETRRDDQRTTSTFERAENTRHMQPNFRYPFGRSSSSHAPLHVQLAACPDPAFAACSGTASSARVPPLADMAQASGRSSIGSLEELFLCRLEAGSGDDEKTSRASRIEDLFIARVCS